MKGELHIETISAYIAVDDDGTEGVLGIPTLEGWMPLVGADEKRMEELEPTAQFWATQFGKTVTLARFSVRTDLKHIEPNRLEPKHQMVRIDENIVAVTKRKEEKS